jgi:TPR repeat protein
MAKKDKKQRSIIGAFVVSGLAAYSGSTLADDNPFGVQEKPHTMERCYWLSRQIPAEGLCGEKMRPDVTILMIEAEKGNNIAAMRLGQLFGTGNWGVKQDYKQAIKWYEHGVKLNDRYSQLQLGQAYEFGRLGVKRDLTKAIKYYNMAAETGLYPQLENKIERLEAKLAKQKR